VQKTGAMRRRALIADRAAPVRSRQPHWAEISVSIHNPEEAQRLLCQAVARRYALLEWDGQRLRSAFWLKRTSERRRAGVDCGQPFTELLGEVASDWDLSFTILYRLVSRRGQTVSWRTLLTIKRHITPQEWKDYQSATVGPRVLRRWKVYEGRLEREIKRHSAKRGRLSGVYPGIAGEAEREAWEHFRRETHRLGIPAPRWQLAVIRVYGPLIAWRPLRRAIGVRTWLKLVRLGWRRERLLLPLEVALLRESRGGPSKLLYS